MCNFCSEIIEIDKQRAISSWDRDNAIVKWFDKEGKINFGFWVEVDDYYYSGVKEKIKYCPKCGRELK